MKKSQLTITPEEAKKMLENREKIILLDVRSEAQFRKKRIPNALLLPLADLQNKAASVIPDKTAVYIVYCRKGRTSRKAYQILMNMGYKKVYNLGGINAWPYETVTQ